MVDKNNRWYKINKDIDLSKEKGLVFTNTHSTPISNGWTFLEEFDKNEKMSMLEIGCQEGRTSIHLLKNYLLHKDSKMYCIDMFEAYGMSQNFDHNMKISGFENKVTKLVGPSYYSLDKIKHSSLDLIYIDGSHHGINVLEDAVKCWRLLKKGGIVIFDDYNFTHPTNDEKLLPKFAIDSWRAIYRPYLSEIKINNNQKAFIKEFSDEDGDSIEEKKKYWI